MPARLLTLGLLVLALLPAACGGKASSTPAASTTTPAPRPAAPRPVAITIKVVSVRKHNRVYSKTPAVTTAGDRVEFSDELRNTVPRFGKGTNETVGTDAGTITYTSTTTARMEGSATLPDGSILFKGDVTVHPDNSVTIPVIGGTGSYEDATGLLHVGTVLDGTGAKRAHNTYELFIGAGRGPIA